MEIEVKIKDQVTKVELEKNYEMIIDRIWDVCDHNDYIIKVDGVEKNEDGTEPIYRITPDFGNLSKNARKNIGKRIQYAMKGNRKSMNVLFLVLRNLGVISERVKIDLSHKERRINNLRTTYKLMRAKTETARLEYKKEKGNFYK